MASPLLTDPWIVEQIEKALAPYAGRMTPPEVEWMREQLVDLLENEEHAARLLRDAYPRDVDQSGEVTCPPLGSIHRERIKAG